MHEKELRERATCAACGHPIGHAELPIFWTIKIERHGLKLDALQRQQGLTMILGGHAALAGVMGPDEEMTTPLMEPVTVTICESCSLKSVCVAQLVEANQTDDDEEEES